MRRVAITGLGAITAAGSDIVQSWDALCAARSGIGPLTRIPTERLNTPVVAQVKAFDPADHFPARQSGTMDLVSQYAVVAARAALADAGLSLDAATKDRVQTIIGVGVGGLNTLDDAFHAVYAEGRPRVHPFTIPRLMTNAPASQISMDLGLRGNAYAIASACASGTHAIGNAMRAIRLGETPVALCGGAEACVTVGTLLGWEALRVMSRDTCRPFSRNRSGMILGEGAAILVLEDWDHAVARGARIYAELAGFGANADAGELTSPDTTNTARAMRLAMDDAGLAPADVDYVNAHGTGTTMNDAGEAEALRHVFPDPSVRPLVSSSKSVFGHTLGAAGAIEAAVTALALYHQIVPPTANCTEPDDTLGFDFVPEGARKMPLDAALSNSFAFGGLNAVLALRRTANG